MTAATGTFGPKPRWITTPPRAWSLAAVTVLPLLYGFAFLALWMVAMANRFDLSGGMPPWVLVVVAVHFLMMLLGFAVLAVYLVDLFRNPVFAADPNSRLVWVIIIIFCGAPAMLVYWWKYLRPSSPESPGRL